jgi:hypothetical protein
LLLALAGVAVKLGRLCTGVDTGVVVIETFGTTMLALILCNVNIFDDITLEFDTVKVVVDDTTAVILRLREETTDVLDTAIVVAVTCKFLDDAIPVTVVETVAATLSVSVWFR